MSRIPWSTLSGDDVEHVVAVLLCSKNERARMIRPSKGDGGYDVVVPVEGDTSKFDVYQIKKFATNLSPGQKNQIEKSLRRVSEGEDAKAGRVRNWYATMPLNPTPENLQWLEAIAAEAPFRAEWRGLNFVESLAAAYPNVIDYYLRDGKDRLQSQLRSLADLIGFGTAVATGTAVLEPGNAWRLFDALQAALDTDPHYRYFVRLLPAMPTNEPASGAIFHAYEYSEDLDRCIAIDVYPRFRDAANERPVTINVAFQPDAEDRVAVQALQDFVRYGKPITTTAKVVADFPGGLGGTYESALLEIGPIDCDVKAQLRLGAFADDGCNPAAEVRLVVREQGLSPTQTGTWLKCTALHGTFQIEHTAHVAERLVNTSLSLALLPLAALKPEDVMPEVEFLLALFSATHVALTLPTGPYPPQEMRWPAEDLRDSANLNVLEAMKGFLSDLIEVQMHTVRQLRIPDLEVHGDCAARSARQAAQLLSFEPQKIGALTVDGQGVSGVQQSGVRRT